MPLIEANEFGTIFHVVHDPVPTGLIEAMEDAEKQYYLLEPGTPVDIMTDWLDRSGEVPVVASRPTFEAPDTINIVADGVDIYTITGLPDPCLISLDGVEHTITGGELPLQSDMPATYKLVLAQQPYIVKYIEVIANAPA